MWRQIKAVLITCLMFFSAIGGFIAGLFFYEKKLDKPTYQVEVGKKSSIHLEKKYSDELIKKEKSKKKFFNFLKRKKK